jgi:hypothetical protein
MLYSKEDIIVALGSDKLANRKIYYIENESNCLKTMNLHVPISSYYL